jgi:hypothetical protein
MIFARLPVSSRAYRLGFELWRSVPSFASDGQTWTTWLVEPSSGSPLLGVPKAWLAFQNEDGSERRRLREFPATWADLPDDRLDLLRRMAELVGTARGRYSPPGARRVTDDDTEA